jgi:hypothetical protein
MKKTNQPINEKNNSTNNQKKQTNKRKPIHSSPEFFFSQILKKYWVVYSLLLIGPIIPPINNTKQNIYPALKTEHIQINKQKQHILTKTKKKNHQHIITPIFNFVIPSSSIKGVRSNSCVEL